MRTRLFVFTVLLVALVAGGSISVAAAGGPPHHAETFTLYALETSFVTLTAGGDVVPPHDEEFLPTVGARFVSVDAVYADEALTEQVGRNDIDCTFTEVGGTSEADFFAALLCHGVLTLDGQGSLSWQVSTTLGGAQAPDPEASFATVALTGGTDTFMAAGGQVVLYDESTSEEVITRYEVTLLDLAAWPPRR